MTKASKQPTKRSDYTPPQRIKFVTDQIIAELECVMPKSTHRNYIMYHYKYTEHTQANPSVLLTKKGMILKVREEDIKWMIQRGVVEIL